MDAPRYDPAQIVCIHTRIVLNGTNNERESKSQNDKMTKYRLTKEKRSQWGVGDVKSLGQQLR